MRTRTVLIALSASLALTATACGSDTPASSPTTPSSTAPASSDVSPATADIVVPTVAPTVDVPEITDPTTDIITSPGDTTVPISQQPAADGEIGQIIGIEWRAVQRITVGALQPVPEGASFIIDDQGRINVETGCNTGSAAITGDGQFEFTLGPLATTKMACSDELNALEGYVLQTLSGTVSWSLDGDTLKVLPTTVTDVGLFFTRASD